MVDSRVEVRSCQRKASSQHQVVGRAQQQAHWVSVVRGRHPSWLCEQATNLSQDRHSGWTAVVVG